MTTFEQARALYGSDEQMARALFEQLAIARLELDLRQAQRRRAEAQLTMTYKFMRKPVDGKGTT